MACTCCNHCQEFCPPINLDQWRDILCFNPYYFWQMAQNRIENPKTPIPVNEVQPCTTIVYESCFQGGKVVGRSEIWQAIKSATDLLYRQFVKRNGYWPTPLNSCDETTLNRPWNGCGKIRTQYAKVLQLGRYVENFIESVDISAADLSDENGDGVLDTITFTLTNPIDNPIIKIGGLNDCQHTIHGARVNGSIVTFRSWQAIKPELFSDFFTEFIVEPNNPENYVFSFDIYERVIDTSDAITIHRRPDRTCCESQETECFLCEVGNGCVIDNARGLITIDLADRCGCPKCIDKICINYISGDCLDVSAVIARLAAAMIGRDLCCNPSGELQYWQGDFVGLTDTGRVVTTLTELERANPFGTRRGQLDAYQFVKSHQRATKAQRI